MLNKYFSTVYCPKKTKPDSSNLKSGFVKKINIEQSLVMNQGC